MLSRYRIINDFLFQQRKKNTKLAFLKSQNFWRRMSEYFCMCTIFVKEFRFDSLSSVRTHEHSATFIIRLIDFGSNELSRPILNNRYTYQSKIKLYEDKVKIYNTNIFNDTSIIIE